MLEFRNFLKLPKIYRISRDVLTESDLFHRSYCAFLSSTCTYFQPYAPNAPPPIIFSGFQVSSLGSARWRESRLDSKYTWTMHPSWSSMSSCESRTRSGSRVMGGCTCGLSKSALVLGLARLKGAEWEYFRTSCRPICVESAFPNGPIEDHRPTTLDCC